VILAYKRNKAGTLQAAYSDSVRVGYIDQSGGHRWIWSLNTIQPQGGRASGIEETEAVAKAALELHWVRWMGAAGLTFKEQQNAESERPANRDRAGAASES
jgi:hypothetical protein